MRCSFPGCRVECYVDGQATINGTIFGKIAHIVAHSDAGPRAKASLPVSERNAYENLILLCANHHDIVDGDDVTYTVEHLRRIKADHEQWVRSRLQDEIAEITFAELEIVTKALLANAPAAGMSFHVIAPDEKIKKNDLTGKVRDLLLIGTMKAREVEQFVQHVGIVDSTFPERLRTGFIAEYKRLFADGLRGDDLFMELFAFAQQRRQCDFRTEAAGLAILTHYFSICDVFES